MPLIKPTASGWNLTPTSMALASLLSTCHGAADAPQMLHGQSADVTVTARGVFAPSMLPLSSTARLRRFAVPSTPGLQVKLQLSRPVARCHLTPPSKEISTALITPPPLSTAV